MADDQESDVVFKEEDVLVDQVGEKGAANLQAADSFAKEYIQDAIVRSIRAAMGAFESFRDYAGRKASQHGAHDAFAKAGKLVGDLIVVATKQMLSSVPVVGILLKHGIMAGLDAANGEENFQKAAQQLVATMARAFSGAAGADELLQAHQVEIRNAWLSAKEPSKKKEAVIKALAGEGIARPAPDAGARIYQQLVETLQIDAWIESCRSGKNARTAECATDGAIPEIKKNAEKEANETFQEDDGKKQGKAMPIG
jgi:hypothetical protein